MARPDASPPPWVAEAGRRLRDRLAQRSPGAGGPPRAGELRVASPLQPGSGERRLVCVIGVDRSAATVEAALASNEVELAGGADLLIPSVETGLDYDLVVASDITATLCWSQLGQPVGRLGSRLAGLLGGMVSRGAGAAPRRARGVPIACADDLRLELRADEHERMRKLAGTDPDRRVPLVIDPGLVALRPGDDAGTYTVRLAAVAAELTAGVRAELPRRAVPAILEAWDRGFVGSPDAWLGLQPWLQRALAAAGGSAGPLVFEPRRSSSPPWSERALAEACVGQAGRGASVIRLLTTPLAWSNPTGATAASATARLGGVDRLRLILHHVEAGR